MNMIAKRGRLGFNLIAACALAACGDSEGTGGRGSPDTGPPADGSVTSDDASTADASGDSGSAPSRGAEHIYVANTRDNTISVIDHATDSVIDTIELGAQPHGQAPSSKGDRIYVTTDGDNGEVIAIDTATREILWRIDAGTALNEPHLTRDDRFLYAPDLLAARTVVVDVEAQEVLTEVAMVDPANGEDLLALHNTYASHDGERMYVTAILSDKIAEIDARAHTLTRIFSLSGQPRPAAITPDDRMMYVQLSLTHGFVELDLETGMETREIEWPEPPDLPEGYEEELLATKCHGLGIRPGGAELWAASNLESNVRVYSLPELEELATVPIGPFPNWIVFSKDGSTAYVTSANPVGEHGSVVVVDAEEHTVKTTIDVGKVPKRIHRVDLPAGR